MLVMVMMVMMMRMVMMMMGGLGSFVAALRQARCHASVVDLCFAPLSIFSRAPRFLAASSSRSRAASAILVVHSFHVSRRCEPRGRGRAICVLCWCWCRATNSTAESRKHSSKFALDARVVTSWAYVLGLRSLHGLWQGRVATFPVEFWTDVQDCSMDRAITSLSIWVLRFHSLVLLICEGPFVESVAIPVELAYIGNRRGRGKIFASELLVLAVFDRLPCLFQDCLRWRI